MGKNKGKRASIFYQVVIILSIHLICGCRITASIPAFQAGDGGSTPLSRSNGMNLTNSAQQRHRILCNFWFLSRFKGCQGLGCPVVSGHYFDRVIEKLMGQLPPDKEFHAHSATLRSHPSVQICHQDHAPPIALYIPIAGCLVRFIPHHCPGSIAGRSPAESRNRGKTESQYAK